MVTPRKREPEITARSQVLNQETVSRILGMVPSNRAFIFYEETAKPIGETAISLSDFCNKINTIPPKSLVFHQNRGDFENWTRDVVADIELARRIGKIRAKKDHTMRTKLYQCVSERITELRNMWDTSQTTPEAIRVTQ